MGAADPEIRATGSPDVPRGSRTYGPSALWTPANVITLVRLLATPVFVAMILVWGANWVAFGFGGVLALSDGVDGWVARRQGATSSACSSIPWPTRSSCWPRSTPSWPTGPSRGCR